MEIFNLQHASTNVVKYFYLLSLLTILHFVILPQPKPEREYEERLRNEIFRWQAPELFRSYEAHKESDVYGLALLIWEMCTSKCVQLNQIDQIIDPSSTIFFSFLFFFVTCLHVRVISRCKRVSSIRGILHAWISSNRLNVNEESRNSI